MLKSILAVIVSYVVMAIFMFVVFTGVYLALGAERAFQPDSYEVSALWLFLAAIISFGGAMLGGYICAVISKSNGACQVLALIVFVLAFVLCMSSMRKADGPNVRAGEVPNMQAMQLAVTPTWMHLLSPVIGAAGVLLGARKKLRSTL